MTRICGSGKRAPQTAAMIPVLSPLKLHKHHLSRVEHSPHYGFYQGECNNPTLWTPHSPILQTIFSVEESAAREVVQKSEQTQGMSVTDYCSFGVGAILPVSREPDGCLSTQEMC